MPFDEGVLVIECVFALSLGLLSVMGRRIFGTRTKVWCIFALFGALIGIECFLGLGSAGALAVGYQSTGTAITSGISDIQFVPASIVLIDLMLSAWVAVVN